jgi:hypothetical protein
MLEAGSAKGVAMSTMGTMSARQWAQAVGLGLALAVAIVAVVAVVLPVAALALAVALLVAGAVALAQQTRAVAQAARAATGSAPRGDEIPQPTLRLELADGAVVSARAVPLPGDGEHTLLLTRDGYVLVNAEGRAVHRL